MNATCRFMITAAMSASAFTSFAGGIPGTGPNSYIYHSDEGMVVCSDCHVQVNGNLTLKKEDITDLCLSCHTEGNNTADTADLVGVAPGSWLAPVVKTATGAVPPGVAMPAGDFYWSDLDPRNGHNPAYTKGSATAPTSRKMRADPVLGSNPPGGAITDGEWSCHSCHSSHFRFAANTAPWRQLKRRINNTNITGDVTVYGVESVTGNITQDPAYEPIKSNSRGDIQNDAYLNMRKDGNPLEGADLFKLEGDTNKNVYRGGFSAFCSACHGNFHGGSGETSAHDNGISRVNGTWVRHPSNLRLAESSKYGVAAYTAVISNTQRTYPNPPGYDWKYPLVKADSDFSVRSLEASGQLKTVSGDDRIMCLTCHKAHATQFRNMTRWDAAAHAFIRAGEIDFAGELSIGDNPAYGCGKCHQMGGTNAFIKGF